MTQQNKEVAKKTGLMATKEMVLKMEPQFVAALPKQIPSKKFARTIMTAISEPRMAEMLNKGTLDKQSLMAACMMAATDGLILDNKDATLVTFFSKAAQKNVVQYIPMVDGIVKKAQNSGQVKDIHRQVVKENDFFEYWIDENGSHFKWMPADGERGKGIKAFAIGLTVNGGRYIEVMSEADIMKVANFSKNTDQYRQEKGEWWESWWKKTVVRRVCRLMPSSSDLERVFEADDEGFDYDNKEFDGAGADYDGMVDITNFEEERSKPDGGSKAAEKIIGKKPANKTNTNPDPQKAPAATAGKEPDNSEGAIEGTATVITSDEDIPI